MGLDFIRDKAGAPWRKQWAGGLERMRTPGLFDLQFESESRRVTMRLRPGASTRINEELVAYACGDRIDVCRGTDNVGSIDSVPEETMRAIVERGGAATGTVVRVALFGDAAEVELG